MLDLALNGTSPQPAPPTILSSSKTDVRPKSGTTKVMGTAINSRVSNLETITESNIDQLKFSWIFQHTGQIADLSLKILFTNQIENCLNSEKSSIDELQLLEKKMDTLIDYYNKEMNVYLFQKYQNNATQLSEDIEIKTDTGRTESDEASSENISRRKFGPSVGVLMSEEQHNKLELIVKLLIYYRNLIRNLISTNANSKSNVLWLNNLRYYYDKATETEKIVLIKVILF